MLGVPGTHTGVKLDTRTVDGAHEAGKSQNSSVLLSNVQGPATTRKRTGRRIEVGTLDVCFHVGLAVAVSAAKPPVASHRDMPANRNQASGQP